MPHWNTGSTTAAFIKTWLIIWFSYCATIVSTTLNPNSAGCTEGRRALLIPAFVVFSQSYTGRLSASGTLCKDLFLHKETSASSGRNNWKLACFEVPHWDYNCCKVSWMHWKAKSHMVEHTWREHKETRGRETEGLTR